MEGRGKAILLVVARVDMTARAVLAAVERK
jgi:hypothetical protein